MVQLTIDRQALGATAGGLIGMGQYFTLALSDANGQLGPAWNTGIGSIGTTSGTIGLTTGLIGTGIGLAGAFSRGSGALARHPTFTAGALTYGLANLLGVAVTSLIPTASVKVPQALAARANAAKNGGGGGNTRGQILNLPNTQSGGTGGSGLTPNQITASKYTR